MSGPPGGYEIVLPGAASSGRSIQELAAELIRQGVPATVVGPGGTLAVASATTAGLTSVATLLQGEFDRGLVLELDRWPRLSIGGDLSRGSLLICHQDGHKERRSGLGNQQIGYVLRTALATVGL